MVRIVAASCLALGVGVLVSYLTLIGKTPFASLEARHLREMKDRVAVPASAEPITLEQLEALPAGLSVAEYSGYERRAVAMEGWVWRMVRSSDGDIHLALAAGAHHPKLEPPAATAEVTPQWRLSGATGGVDPAKGWSYRHLATVFRPDGGGVTAWDAGPARVRLTGWLLYDYEEGAPHPFRFEQSKRRTEWEIHPVTKIERWDEALGRWQEVAR